ncbi:hypothetical protein [Verminephrobacter aporrectodeae]|uniref:hypothetical protein n=1 Tax=Verminephrobacter aporrectodeae TaxID=1110389 RepID=UPI00223914BD|nr:hypothetical protein [Verminephrobacter aporrectodeae]
MQFGIRRLNITLNGPGQGKNVDLILFSFYFQTAVRKFFYKDLFSGFHTQMIQQLLVEGISLYTSPLSTDAAGDEVS